MQIRSFDGRAGLIRQRLTPTGGVKQQHCQRVDAQPVPPARGLTPRFGMWPPAFLRISPLLASLMVLPQATPKPSEPSWITQCVLETKPSGGTSTALNKMLPSSLYLYHAPLIPYTQVSQVLQNQLEAVMFKSTDGLALQGYWLQGEPSAKATVILGHGYRMDWRMNVQLANELHKAGYNVFLFDFRGHGQSGGHLTSLGLNEGRDIAGAVRFVSETYLKQSQRMVYYGHSMGAAAALMLPHSLADDPANMAYVSQHLDGLILDSPFLKLNPLKMPFIHDKVDIVADHFGKSGPARNLFMRGVRQLNQVIINDVEAQLHANLSKTNSADGFKDSSMGRTLPLLIFHGTDDRLTPFSHAQTIHQTLQAQNPHVTLVPLEHADHLQTTWRPTPESTGYVSSVRSEEMLNQLLGFLRRYTLEGNPFSLS